MITITNLKDAKDLAVGELFIFGEHEYEPIEWRKIDENLAISEKVIDCVIFDTYYINKGYANSKLRKWCNEKLGKSLGLSEDTIYELSYEETLNYFPTDESRQAKPTERAIMHGIFFSKNGFSSYWLSTLEHEEKNAMKACIVTETGSVDKTTLRDFSVGVRPALKFG